MAFSFAAAVARCQRDSRPVCLVVSVVLEEVAHGGCPEYTLPLCDVLHVGFVRLEEV